MSYVGKFSTLGSLAAILISTGCGESVTQTPNTTKASASTVSTKLVFQNGALNRAGCQGVKPWDNNALEEYFKLIEETQYYDPVEVRRALAKTTLAFGCMSARDFSSNYDMAMKSIIARSNKTERIVRLAPLVLSFTELGSSAIDLRARQWLKHYHSVILEHFIAKGTWADGIGFYSLRGTTLVALESEEILKLVKSFDSLFWVTNTCRISSTIILPNEYAANGLIPVCVLDPCPGVNPKHLRENQTYDDACREARGHLDQKININGAGASQGGQGTGGPSISGSISPAKGTVENILSCMAQFSANNSARQTACVQAIASSLSSANDTFTVNLNTTMKPQGCSLDPLAQGPLIDPEKSKQRQQEQLRRTEQRFDDYKEEYNQASSDITGAKADIQKAETKQKYIQKIYDSYVRNTVLCSDFNSPYQEASCRAADQLEEDLQRELDLPKDTIPTQGYVTDEIQRLGEKINDLKVKIDSIIEAFKKKWKYETDSGELEDIDPTNPPRETLEVLPEEKTKARVKNAEEDDQSNSTLSDSSNQVCEVTGEGCSTDCGIEEQMEASLGHCVGYLPKYDQVPSTPQPGDPSVMYPNPDDVTGTTEFDKLTSCLATAIGLDAAVETPKPDKLAICNRIICPTATSASLDDQGKCNCGGTGVPSEIEAMASWEGFKNQCAYMSCSSEDTCACHGFNTTIPVTLPGVSGGPVDPSVFLTFDYKITLP